MKSIFRHAAQLMVSVLVMLVMVVPVNASNSAYLPDGPIDETPQPEAVAEPAIVPQDGNELMALAGPVINVWYEGNLHFGHIGNPQEWVNIMGNVYDPDGSVSSLTYRLNNGSPISLDIGTSSSGGNVRLERDGDFNASLPVSVLQGGTNTIVFTARDDSNTTTQKTVNFTYTSGRTWPLPYFTNWSSAGGINNQAQVVDGLWTINGSTVYMSPQNQGYDRLIAIGNINWSNYEVVVPITIHSFHPVGSDSGGVGIITGFQGHYGSGQPPTAWDKIGAYGYYSNRLEKLALRINSSNPAEEPFDFSYNQTYMFKMRAETINTSARYSLKVWKQGMPEPPWGAAQFVNLIDADEEVLAGSVLLVAHRASATFGNVKICTIGGLDCQDIPVSKMYIATLTKQ